MITARDGLCIQWSREQMWGTAQSFASLTEEDARDTYHLGKDARDWKVAYAQRDLRQASGPKRDHVVEGLYRPFDRRFTYFTGKSRGFHCMPRGEVMRQMLAGRNVGLHLVRQTSIPSWQHVLASNGVTDSDYVSNLTSDRGYLLPLYRYPSEQELTTGLGKEPNLNPTFLAALAAAVEEESSRPEDVFQYVYAVLHSPTYRTRYVAFLSIDFPRMPLPASLALLRDLARLGEQLVALHLMQSPKLADFTSAYTGPRNPQVGRVVWCNDTVWLDAASTKSCQPGTPGFQSVPAAVWDFQIGGYQVCHKWLKDRKGRTLTDDDIAHYQKIVVAIAETIRIMGEIDEVIEEYGGWPKAFSRGAGDEG